MGRDGRGELLQEEATQRIGNVQGKEGATTKKKIKNIVGARYMDMMQYADKDNNARNERVVKQRSS